MTAAAFVLVINIFLAAIFAASFGIVAAYQRSAVGARWLAGAYAMGVVNPLLEFVLPYQADHRPVSFAIFAVFLLALAMCAVGLARHYRVPVPKFLLGFAVTGGLLLNVLIIDMPHADLLRAVLYQLPYTVLQLITILVVLANPRKRALDFALMALLFASALHFLAKPYFAARIGAGEGPQAYLQTSYAALSQSFAAILLVATGLFMLLIIVRDVMADMTRRSETDTLSGLFNRRGFDERGDRALELAMRQGLPLVVVVADLDHFKRINDTHGHSAGDGVIAAFARTLRHCADDRAIVGRIGGEEFAIILPGANLGAGRLYAETVRSAFRGRDDAALPPSTTASFGVAALRPGERWPDILHRADAALYQAKTLGRDRVVTAPELPLRVVEALDAATRQN